MSSSVSSPLLRTLVLALGLGAAACAGAAHPATTAPTRTAHPTSSTDQPGGRAVHVVGNFDPVNGLADDPVAEAAAVIARGDLVKARAMLEAVVADMPDGWQRIRRQGDRTEIAAWDLDDLIAYVAAAHADPTLRTVVWVGPSYARAHALLGYIAVEQHDLARAAAELDAGLALQVHADLLTERGTVAVQQGEAAAGLGFFVRATELPGASDAQRARGWRGRGQALIELGQLDDAEQALHTSLTIEADNQLAKNELEYIRRLRAGEIAPNAPQIVPSR